jgi:hypothetical protein
VTGSCEHAPESVAVALWGLGHPTPEGGVCQLCNGSACAPADPPSRGDGVAGLPGHCPCRAPAATSVTPVTQHRQRPAKRSAPPFIAEIPAFAETFGCYSYPFLPRKPYVPRYCDGSRLQVRNGVSGHGGAPATRLRAPRPRRWSLGHTHPIRATRSPRETAAHPEEGSWMNPTSIRPAQGAAS